jgi:transcriptional regulator with XRE-family HTH domain
VPCWPRAVPSAGSWLGPEYHSLNDVAPGIINPMHIAQKFEGFLEMYRRPDGRRWSGQEIDEATGGVVTRSYVTNLRKGRIENPGYEKMRAIAKAMSFPPEVWFEEHLGDGATHRSGRRVARRGRSVGARVRGCQEPEDGRALYQRRGCSHDAR